jgi:hypothetical protein
VTDRSFEVAHDEKLMELITASYEARRQLEIREKIALAAACPSTGRSYLKVTYDGWIRRPAPEGFSAKSRWDTIPEGTIFHKEKGSNRYNPSGFCIMLANSEDYREATFADAEPFLTPQQRRDYFSAKVELVVAQKAIVDHEAGYTGWSRFFLVTSSAGHVHSSTSCSSCYMTTTFALLTELSAQSCEDAIAEVGETLCTVCFPDAPIAGKPKKITKAAVAKLVSAT